MTMFIDDNGGWVLFLWVLGNQAAVPVPVVPPLLRQVRSPELISSSCRSWRSRGHSALRRLTWYAVGRWRGVQTLSRLRRHFPIGGEGELPSLHRATAWLNSPP